MALYYCVAFFGIFMFNAVVICAINASALYVSMYSIDDDLLITDYIGIFVWFSGFIILLVADNQLRKFKNQRN